VSGEVRASVKSVSAEIVPAFLLEHPMVWMVPSFAVNASITMMWFWFHLLLWEKVFQGLHWVIWFAVGG
jgi:hypothetical protein